MADSLKANEAGAQAPPGQQNVAITNGQATTTIQAPTSTGNIWFAFSPGSGSATLNVNFNGYNYPNVQPGEYTLGGLTTPLGLTATVNGSTKLAWLAF